MGDESTTGPFLIESNATIGPADPVLFTNLVNRNFQRPSRSNRSNVSEADSEESKGLRLRLRGTFIDLGGDDDGQDQLSPRPLSDPGSEVSSGYTHSSYFAKERTYVAGLSQKVSQTFSNKRLSMGSARSGHSADHSDSGYGGLRDAHDEDSEDASTRRGPIVCEQEDMSPSSKLHGVMSHKFLVPRPKAAHRIAPSSNSSDVSSQHPPNYPGLDKRPIQATVKSERMELNRPELRHLVNKKTAEINDVLKYQRLTTALTSINEIPEHVGEVFHQSAANLLDEVHGEISNARDWIETGKEWNDDQHEADERFSMEEKAVKAAQRVAEKEKAAQSITMIPDMIMASFENSFAKAMSTVRIRVDDVIQGLECSDMAKDQVVKQMWAIPEEVRQITREAVKEASKESRVKVAEQLDSVLQSFTESVCEDPMEDSHREKKKVAFEQAKSQIVARVPKKLPDTLRAATEAAESNVCQAIRFVEAKSDVTGVVANRVVADTLLRAKVGPKLDKAFKPGENNVAQTRHDPGLETLRICNPGSVGHPQLCSRACLYFAQGKCSNGMNCDFCHAPHSKRATHLDKRHREMLRSMQLAERFFYVYPILKSKLQSLDIASDVMQVLDALYAMTLEKVPPNLLQQNEKRKKEARTLQVALKFLSVRSLLTLLQHAPMPADSPEHDAVEELVKVLRPDPQLPGPTLGVPEDQDNRSHSHKSEDNRSQSRKSEKSIGRSRSRTSFRSHTPDSHRSAEEYR